MGQHGTHCRYMYLLVIASKSRFFPSLFMGWENGHREIKECAIEYPVVGLGSCMAISKPVLGFGSRVQLLLVSHTLLLPCLSDGHSHLCFLCFSYAPASCLPSDRHYMLFCGFCFCSFSFSYCCLGSLRDSVSDWFFLLAMELTNVLGCDGGWYRVNTWHYVLQLHLDLQWGHRLINIAWIENIISLERTLNTSKLLLILAQQHSSLWSIGCFPLWLCGWELWLLALHHS